MLSELQAAKRTKSTQKKEKSHEIAVGKGKKRRKRMKHCMVQKKIEQKRRLVGGKHGKRVSFHRILSSQVEARL